MAESQDLQLVSVESNIFRQFDVQQKGEPVPGQRPVYQYICLLSHCSEKESTFTQYHALKVHRKNIHKLSEEQNQNLPNKYAIDQWMAIGKPRPYEVPLKEKEPTRRVVSLKENLLHNEPAMAELQPATLESNIYEQFDVRCIEGRPSPLYFCLLRPCFGLEFRFKSRQGWQRHRENFHRCRISGDENLPSGYEIRAWAAEKKPRPYNVPVKLKSKWIQPEDGRRYALDESGCSSQAGPALKKLHRSSFSDKESPSREDYDNRNEHVDDEMANQTDNPSRRRDSLMLLAVHDIAAEMAEVGETVPPLNFVRLIAESVPVMVPRRPSMCQSYEIDSSSEDCSRMRAELVTPIQMATGLDANVAHPVPEEEEPTVALPEAE